MAGLPWIKMHVDLPRHPKAAALAVELGDRRAWTYVAALLLWAGDNAPDGVIRSRNPGAMLEHVLDWDKETGQLVAALLAVGFLEQDGETLRIHDWDAIQGAHVAKVSRDRAKPDGRKSPVAPAHPPQTSLPTPARDSDGEIEIERETEKKEEKPLSAGADGGVGQLSLSPEPTGTALEANTKDVFDYWRRASGRSGRTVLDSHRRTRVLARLREGSTVAELCEAVDGCLATPHNRGENETGQRYDDLELICRSAANVERFRRNAVTPPKRPPKTNRQPDWNADHLRDADGNLSFV